MITRAEKANMRWIEWFNNARQFIDGLTLLVFSIGLFVLFVVALVKLITHAV